MRITPEISKKPPRLEIVFRTWAKTFLLQNISEFLFFLPEDEGKCGFRFFRFFNKKVWPF